MAHIIKKNSDSKDAIEWLILEVKDGKVLLLSKYALDCKQYNTSGINVTWETCSLRKWLNDEFVNVAFTDDEKAMISMVTVSADKNPKYDTNPGNDTQDKVFLLSITEANKYFDLGSARQCKPTAYAIADGAYVNDSNGNCWWWLRSPGYNQDYVANVGSDGGVRELGISGGGVSVGGRYVHYDDIAVRPALWINLDS